LSVGDLLTALVDAFENVVKMFTITYYNRYYSVYYMLYYIPAVRTTIL
jgi:hypothetical protein